MKIRIVTALVAVSVLGMPLSVPGQIRVRSFDSYVRNMTKGPCQAQLLDLLEVIDTYYHVADVVITVDSEGWRYGTQNGNCFKNDIYTYESWPALGVNGLLVWEEYDQQGNLVDYWEDENEPFWTGQLLPWRRWNRTVYQTNSWNNISYAETYHTNDIVTIDLVTGGTPGINGQRLWRLDVEANDSVTGHVIDPRQITLLGKTAFIPTNSYPYTNIGVVYKVLSDHTIVDATPTIPGANVTYDVEPFSARLRIKWGNTDITDKTNVVWVGEKIELSCVLSPQIDAITNYFWQVGGQKIKDWVVSGTGTNATTAEVILWGYNSNRTSATTQFIWVRDSTNQTVTCTVQVAGETLIAQAKFEVRRPDAIWTLTAKYGKVVVTNTLCYVQFPGYYHLATGVDCELNETNWNDVGMQFNYQITDLKGYTDSYDVSFVQFAYIDWKWNMTPPPVGPTTYKSIAKNTRGLDELWPYRSWGQSLSGSAWDTPTAALLERYSFHWRFDEFQAYLMWQSTRRPSIPVPLKVASWNWYGKTERIDLNSPPTWRLLSSTKPVSTVGTECYTHPIWTT